jgi:peptidoglycan-N-acetylglucosamine deacetylase
VTMTPRWRWDFEDDNRTGGKRRPPPPPPDSRATATEAAQSETTPSARRREQIRRRRVAAIVIAIGLLALIVVAFAGAHHTHTPPPSARGRHGGARVARATAHSPAPEAEDHQDAAVKAVLAYTPFVREGGTRGREIALTFDDGPGPYTPGILDVLERARVHATFFEIGRMLQYFGESTAREIRDGDVIGDHTETHPMMAQLSARDQHEELFEQIARVELLGGPRPVLFRPPYGSFNATTMRELHAMHLLMVLWSVDTDDYLQPGVETIVTRALEGAHPGAIILMHDAGGTRTQTIAALPTIIAKLRARGYRLVTVPQLLKDDPPPAGQPLPPNLSGD